jgi:flagellar motor switch protein FliM
LSIIIAIYIILIYNTGMEENKLTIKINGESLLEKYAKKTSLHKLHLRSGVSYPTLRRMMAGESTRISLNSLVEILLALMPPENIMELKFGDVFKFEEKNEEKLSVYRKG